MAPSPEESGRGGDAAEAGPGAEGTTLAIVGRGEGAAEALYVLGPELFNKPSKDPSYDRIMKMQSKVGSIIYTTGQTWTGAQGGTWVEVDREKCRGHFGWYLLEGPAGPLLAPKDEVIHVELRGVVGSEHVEQKVPLAKSASVGHLADKFCGRMELNPKRLMILKGEVQATVVGEDEEERLLGFECCKRADILERSKPVAALGRTTLGFVYLGDTERRDRGRDSEAVPEEPEGEPLGAEDEPGEMDMAEDDAHFVVLHHGLPIREKPSRSSKAVGVLYRKNVVFGRPYTVRGQPWLHLDSKSCAEAWTEASGGWALIHGTEFGLGQLLQRLPPDEEAERRKTRAGTGMLPGMQPAAAKPAVPPEDEANMEAMKKERALVEAARQKVEEERTALQAQLAALEATKEGAGAATEGVKAAPAAKTFTMVPKAEWSTNDVAQFLGTIELEHLCTNFMDNGVDGELLIGLTEQDLTSELGLTKLQARKVIKKLEGMD